MFTVWFCRTSFLPWILHSLTQSPLLCFITRFNILYWHRRYFLSLSLCLSLSKQAILPNCLAASPQLQNITSCHRLYLPNWLRSTEIRGPQISCSSHWPAARNGQIVPDCIDLRLYLAAKYVQNIHQHSLRLSPPRRSPLLLAFCFHASFIRLHSQSTRWHRSEASGQVGSFSVGGRRGRAEAVGGLSQTWTRQIWVFLCFSFLIKVKILLCCAIS